ncbi:hypothetical protein U1Q18_030069 [Sarracenia purpurea var. burkii]
MVGAAPADLLCLFLGPLPLGPGGMEILLDVATECGSDMTLNTSHAPSELGILTTQSTRQLGHLPGSSATRSVDAKVKAGFLNIRPAIVVSDPRIRTVRSRLTLEVLERCKRSGRQTLLRWRAANGDMARVQGPASLTPPTGVSSPLLIFQADLSTEKWVLTHLVLVVDRSRRPQSKGHRFSRSWSGRGVVRRRRSGTPFTLQHQGP